MSEPKVIHREPGLGEPCKVAVQEKHKILCAVESAKFGNNGKERAWRMKADWDRVKPARVTVEAIDSGGYSKTVELSRDGARALVDVLIAYLDDTIRT